MALDIPNMINRKGRISRFADLMNQIIAETEKKAEGTSHEELDLAVKILMLDDLDRIAQALEIIADKL